MKGKAGFMIGSMVVGSAITGCLWAITVGDLQFFVINAFVGFINLLAIALRWRE